MWVKYPQQSVPAFGWLREGGRPWLDTFFASDTFVIPATTTEIEPYRLPAYLPSGTTRPPNRVILHEALRRQIPTILSSRVWFVNAAHGERKPLTTPNEWKALLGIGYPISLYYVVPCANCRMLRKIERDEARTVERLPTNFRFMCKHAFLQYHAYSHTT